MNKYSDKKIEDLSFNLIPIIGIFICLFFGGSISNEISSGTFRFYLSKPVNRGKIYTSKVLTAMIYSYISVLKILIFSSIISSKIDLKYYSKFLTYSIPLFFLSAFIIYLSSKFKSSSLTITLGILLFSFSLVFSQILFNINFKFIRFTFLPYLDFTLFDDKLSLKVLNKSLGVTLGLRRGVLINIIYTLLFYILGIISFKKKDIKA